MVRFRRSRRGRCTGLAVGSILTLVLGSLAAAPVPVQGAEAALAEFVARPDASYAWKLRETGTVGDCSFARLHLVSQTWRGQPWRHVLWVLRPNDLPPGDVPGLLLIGGGSWRAEWPDEGPDRLALPNEARLVAPLAAQAGSVIAVLQQIPSQPLMGGKYEDEIISETFVEFLRSGDPDWPLLMPMVKGAVRGMDAVEEFAAQHWDCQLSGFTVTGASKRGWTTWLTAAADPRVRGIAPIVIDMLNLAAQMPHQLASWGKYSEQIEDYSSKGLQQQLDTPRGRELLGLVDPYAYRAQLTVPKLLIFGTNDRYWPLDACRLYWDGLPGDKHLLYVPNEGHGIGDMARVLGGLLAFHRAVHTPQSLPRLRWEFAADDQAVALRLRSDAEPQRLQVWMARSATRDFRDARWISVPYRAEEEEAGHRLELPPQGYLAAFGEAVYASDSLLPAYQSTGVQIFQRPTTP